mmetsp:Transcript_19777/g.46255  ORF Transcript_19777/g.46255 Transcript_19777/m.46255 type:complete len:291 (+) Transcript_19777:140-1012(+)|eukprot:CAMPEP_0197174312 /NCGR_PEP_ID=MMETSP1423-20130617/889_1 /TAXON_ID=476441 /ORGANISM="Pseudo-nitzschia heimii, Strain UNC1101" /LENGTH=290 /DNA_ID=CAMNT_0042623227 /DNA_START=105 /DNA_END=977 /DNA_ORIENTATION=-
MQIHQSYSNSIAQQRKDPSSSYSSAKNQSTSFRNLQKNFSSSPSSSSSSNSYVKKSSTSFQERQKNFSAPSSSSSPKKQSSSIRDLQKTFAPPSTSSYAKKQSTTKGSSFKDRQKNFSAPSSTGSYRKNQPGSSEAQRRTFSSSPYSSGYSKNQPKSPRAPAATAGSFRRFGSSVGSVNRATKPTKSYSSVPSSKKKNTSCTQERMFEFSGGKAEVEILDSYEDDQLAASTYGGAPKKDAAESGKNKRPTLDRGVSGYNFDLLLGNDDEESTSSYTSATGHDSLFSVHGE